MTDEPDIVYSPERFHVTEFDQAKTIICQPEVDLSPAERWEKETAWLMPQVKFEPTNMVVDYGCGAGRIAKQLDCDVLGVDIALSMRIYAESYVSRSNFGSLNPVMFKKLIQAGFQADGAVAVWVLQHCFDVEFDIRLIAASLIPCTSFFVVNRPNRCIPVRRGDTEGWIDDGVDIDKLLMKFFNLAHRKPIPTDLAVEGAHFTEWVRNFEEADISEDRETMELRL